MSMPFHIPLWGSILVLEAIFNRIYAKAVVEFGDDAVARMIEVLKKTGPLSEDASGSIRDEDGGGAA